MCVCVFVCVCVCFRFNMAQGPVGLFALCVFCVYVLRIPVVAALENATMSVNSSSIVQRIKKLKIEALKSGKIRIDKVHSEIYSKTHFSDDNGDNGGQILCVDQWQRFQTEDNFTWQDFENQERLLRKNLETKPMCVKTRYTHPNPSVWIKLITLVSNIFFKDNVCVDIRPDNKPFSIEFIKFVRRVLFKFPVKSQVYADPGRSERELLLSDIEYVVTFVKRNIQPCFNRQRNNNPAVPPDGDSDRETDSDTVSRAELTHL